MDKKLSDCGFLNDSSLSAAARGVLATALSLPSNTSVSIHKHTGFHYKFLLY